jgi:hypothetical protein
MKTIIYKTNVTLMNIYKKIERFIQIRKQLVFEKLEIVLESDDVVLQIFFPFHQAIVEYIEQQALQYLLQILKVIQLFHGILVQHSKKRECGLKMDFIYLGQGKLLQQILSFHRIFKKHPTGYIKSKR